MNSKTFMVSQMLFCKASHPDSHQKLATPSSVPYLGAAVLEELKEFGDHNVEGSVQSVTVQQLRRVLANLLQCSKRALRHGHTQRGCQIKTQTYTDTEERTRLHQSGFQTNV